MIKPDVHLVAEVMLQCFGFIDVKNLSSKLVFAYERFHTLLSRQSHYNFGKVDFKQITQFEINSTQSFLKLLLVCRNIFFRNNLIYCL